MIHIRAESTSALENRSRATTMQLFCCFFFLNRGLITGLTDVLLSIPVQGWESYTKSIHIYKGIKTLSIYARLAVYLLILCIFVL